MSFHYRNVRHYTKEFVEHFDAAMLLASTRFALIIPAQVLSASRLPCDVSAAACTPC